MSLSDYRIVILRTQCIGNPNALIDTLTPTLQYICNCRTGRMVYRLPVSLQNIFNHLPQIISTHLFILAVWHLKYRQS